MLLHEIGRRRAPRRASRTVEGLQWLAAHRYPIHKTWVLDIDGKSDDPALEQALQRIIDPKNRYAVRLAREPLDEDSDGSTWGTPVTSVAGPTCVLRAVRQAAAHSASVEPDPQADDEVPLRPPSAPHIVVQEIAPSLLRGVAYSADPVTALDEVVVEVATDAAIPERWVRKWGVWKTRPSTSDSDESTIERVAAEVASIGRQYGYPVRAEWTWDGERIVYGGLAEVSTIEGANFHSRRILEALAPDAISPLVWSVALPTLGRAWLDVVQEVVGPVDLEPTDLARRFHCRAYADAGALGVVLDAIGVPRETLEPLALGLGTDAQDRPRIRLTTRSLARTPRAVAFACRNVRLEPHVRRELPALDRRLDAFVESTHPEDLTARQVEERLDELAEIVNDAARLDVTCTLASALFDHLLERSIAPLGIEIDEIDFGDGDSGMEGRDPAAALGRLHGLWEALPPGTRSAVAGGRLTRVKTTKVGTKFLAEVDEFLLVYGHFSDARIDLAKAPWREDVRQVLRMIAAHRTAARGAATIDRDRLSGLGGTRATLRAYDRAATWRVLRGDCASAFGKAYVAIRPLLLRLGDILVRRGWLDCADDAFMLTRDELSDATAFRIDERTVRDLVEAAHASMAASAELDPPDVVFGDIEPSTTRASGTPLKGTPVAGGYAAGPTVHVADPEDADGVRSGDIAILAEQGTPSASLLERVAALVIAEGGFDAPAAAACRAHMVPAIVLADALELVPEGASIALDGFTGAVDVLARETALVAVTHGAAS